MARNRTFIAATIVTLSLSSLTAAQAQDRDRYAYPNSNRDSSSVDRLAEEVEDIAAGIYREYARNNRRPDHAERRALEGLRDLNARADRFSNVVDDRRRDSQYGAREYQALVNTFFETEDSLDRISRRPYVDQGMRQISQRLRQMDRYFERYGDRDGYRGGDRNDRWDRYDRDRDGRRDRYDGRRP